MPRGIENHGRLQTLGNRMRVEPHQGRMPHGLNSIRTA